MLRKSKTIVLGQDESAREVVVQEITPELLHRLYDALWGALETAKPASIKDVASLVSGEVATKLELLEACSSLGAEVRQVGGAAFLLLWDAFEEVNQDFLAQMVARLGKGVAALRKATTGLPIPAAPAVPPMPMEGATPDASSNEASTTS